jgi:formamidopyrimidine-DNA glycosylase
MPELPEVETVARSIRPHVLNKRIVGALVYAPKTVQLPAQVTAFQGGLLNNAFTDVTRRAKYVVMTLERGQTLLIHLRMTGRLYVTASRTPFEDDRWIRASITFADGDELRFSDPRRFGRMALVDDPNIVLGGLGPEPLDDSFTPEAFAQRLQRHKRGIKATLLDQAVIAGVGNIYADEALFRARIHPLRASNSLSQAEALALYHAVRGALQDGIIRQGASIQWYRTPDGERGMAQDNFAVYGRDGQACPVCGTIISKIRVAQRGTHFCPACQAT